MKKIFETVKANPLFQGIGLDEFEKILYCMQGRVQRYRKGETILFAGSPVEKVGLMLSGTAQVLREDAEGKQNLMTGLAPGELFGEVFACAGIAHSPVRVLSTSECKVLHLHYRKVVTVCPATCPFHQRMVENMLTLVARKNLLLNQKIELLSKRTTRERLLGYFDTVRHGAIQFTIPLNREELAAYLCVERSAMSAELSKMRRDGLIVYHKNTFELL